MKAMNIPVYTISQDEYKNKVFAFLDTSQLGISIYLISPVGILLPCARQPAHFQPAYWAQCRDQG